MLKNPEPETVVVKDNRAHHIAKALTILALTRTAAAHDVVPVLVVNNRSPRGVRISRAGATEVNGLRPGVVPRVAGTETVVPVDGHIHLKAGARVRRIRGNGVITNNIRLDICVDLRTSALRVVERVEVEIGWARRRDRI